MAAGSKPSIALIAGSAVVGDHGLVQLVATYLENALAEGKVPLLIALGDLLPSSQAMRTQFVERLRGRGLTLRFAPASRVEPVRGDAQPYVVIVHPDLALPVLDDVGAIGIASTIGCPAVFLTQKGCLETAESPFVEGGEVLEHLSFEEMLEVTLGAETAVSARATQHAWLTNTPFKIYALETGRWTTVTHDTYGKRVRVPASVTIARELSYVVATRDEYDETGSGASRLALATLARQGIRIEQVRTLRNGLTFACDVAQTEAALSHLRRTSFIATAEPCIRLCAIGTGLQATPGVIHAVLDALETSDVLPLHLSDSAATISILVRELEAAQAEEALRRTFLTTERLGTTTSGQFAFDATTRTLRVRDRSEKLGLRQAKLLHLLMENVGKPVDIESAAQVLFGNAEPAALAAVRVHIHNIRKKIEDDPVDPKYILTVPNRGYTFARQLGLSVQNSHGNHAHQTAGVSKVL